MRQRVEDLGRIAVMVREIIDQEIFDNSGRLTPRRPKDCAEWWASKSDEQKDETLHSLAYEIQSIESQLYDVLSIAEGTDNLNSMLDNQKQ